MRSISWCAAPTPRHSRSAYDARRDELPDRRTVLPLRTHGDGAINAVPIPAGAQRLTLTVRVTDGAEQPVGDAVIEVFYAPAATPDGGCLFARLPTRDDGTCTFELAQPAAHVNVCLFARGLLRHLHTR